MAYSMNTPPNPFVCNQCHQSFFGKDTRTGTPTSRYPLILTCGHTACLMCLKSSAKKQKYFCCPTCKRETPFPNGESDVNCLLPDLYILGVLSLSTKTFVLGQRDLNKLKFFPAGGEPGQTAKAKFRQNGLTSQASCDECFALAKWWCKQCQSHYCGQCFDKIHNVSKALRKHTGVPLHALEYRSAAQKGCTEHDQHALDYFCEEDNSLICSVCALQGSHKGHMCISLVEKNESCLPELRLAMEEAKKVRARMRHSLKKLEDLKASVKIDIEPMEQEIRDNFHQYHTALQLREWELLKQLHEYSECNKTTMDSINESLSTNIKEITAHISDAEMMMKCNYTAINGVSLIKELQNSHSLPCYILPTGKPQSSINVHVSQKLLQHIHQACSIEADIQSRYEILTDEQLPTTFIKEPLPDELLTDTESAPSVNSSTTEILLTPSDSSEPEKKKKFRFITPKNSKILRHEHVKVVHINSPSSFYVQYSKDGTLIRTLASSIQKWCNNPSSSLEVPEIINEGTMYLAQYEEDNKWYRAKVNKVLMASSLDPTLKDMFETVPADVLVNKTGDQESCNGLPDESSEVVETCNQVNVSESDGSVPSNKKTVMDWFTMSEVEQDELVVHVNPDQLVQITYMDFGNTDVVPVYRIKNIPSKLMSHPFFAHECSLWEILPAEGNQDWSEDARNVFLKFVDKQTLLMSVIEENSGILYVDLNQPAHSDVSNDTPVSVREALIFMELAQYPNIGASREIERCATHKSYFPSDPIQPGGRVDVLVSHIECPTDFYVTLQGGLSRYFGIMNNQLQNRYSELDGDQLTVFAPRIGHPYVALSPEDQRWYRVLVESQAGHSNVKVKFVDLGKTQTVPHFNLRKLTDQFIKFPIQAIHCVMADILPCRQQWDNQATDWLKNKTQSVGVNLQMTVHKCTSGDKYVVSLFKQGDEADICLNGLIVKEGLARSSGPGSGLVEIPKEIILPQPLPVKLLQSLPSKQKHKKDQIENPVPSIRMKKKSKLDVLRESRSDIMPSGQALVKEVKEKSIVKGKSKGFPVKVSKFDSPGCFYTQKVSCEADLIELMKDLQNYHLSEETGSVDLTVGSLVSALKPESVNSFRGRITAVKEISESVEVEAIDYGWIIEVPQENLKPLPALFARGLTYATRCHLAGLIPAGGSTWTRVACEFTQESIAQADELLLVLKQQISDAEDIMSIPVDILLKEIIPGGALEPSRVKLNSLADALMEHGYALSEEKFNRRNNVNHVNPVLDRTSTPLDWTGSQCESVVSDETICLQNGNEIDIGVESEYAGESENAVESETCYSDSEDTIQSDISIPCSDVGSDWQPAVIPGSASFLAYPTYVGYDSCIYLHDKDHAHGVLNDITESLGKIFSKDRYQKPRKVVKVGQICVALYMVDKKWYRGKIHKVLDEFAEIIFVDYGNVELVSFEDIRLFATHMDIPLQCLECELYNVRPISDNGQWPTATLDLIHKTIVEQPVLVTIKEVPVSGKRLKISLTLTGGDTLTDILVKEKLAHMVQPNLMLLSGGINNPYRCLPNPVPGSIFHVVVTHMIDPGLICIQRPKTELNQELDAFLSMINTITETAAKQPLLRSPSIGTACLGQYSFDESWYRCVITDSDDDQATVVFIDYGNSETIPLNSKRLKVIPPSFLNVAAQAMTCRLYAIVSPEGEWTLPAHEAMTELLFPSQSVDDNMMELMAQVMDDRTPIEIILTERGNSSQPIYQSLIDDGILATRI